METTNFSLLPGAVLRGATATYKIVRTLGQGTFGITYLAETTDNASGVQSYVAVKEFFMKAKNSRNGSTVNTGCADNVFDYYKKKFEEEALHIKALKHPNIVKCSETFCANISPTTIKGTVQNIRHSPLYCCLLQFALPHFGIKPQFFFDEIEPFFFSVMVLC